MRVIRNTPETIAIYESDYGINQSGLKEIMFNGIQSFLVNKENLQKTDKYFEDKEHFLIGKAADVKMSFDKDMYGKLYHTSVLEDKPSDTMMKVLHMTLEQLQDHSEIFHLNHESYAPIIHNMLNTVESIDKGEKKVGYYMNRAKGTWQADTRMGDIYNKKECLDYWQDIVKARGKQVLTVSENAIVEAITTSWTSHPNTAHLFQDNPDEIRIYQMPVYFIVNNVRCKGLIVMVVINLANGTIKLYDFKTMRGFTLMFPRTIRGRRYDLQGSYYYEGLFQNLTLLSNLLGVDVTTFRIDNPIFIVESTTNPGLPLQFQLDDSLMAVGRRGDERLSGYEQLVDEYAYWLNYGFDIEAAIKNSPITGLLTVDSQFNFIKP